VSGAVVEVVGAELVDEIACFRVEGRAGAATLPAHAAKSGAWRDAHDLHARHWIVRNESGAVCAAARLCVHAVVAELPDAAAWGSALDAWPGPYASLNRLTVRADRRGRGLARALDIVRLDAAAAVGARTAVGTLMPPDGLLGRLAALRALGFHVVGAGASPDWPGREMTLVARRVVP
jgi:hypothetical protein